MNNNMKRTLFLFLLSTILSVCLNSQETCRVKMSTISDTYKGTCRQGLADGQGEASGIDFYTGSFRKGFPDGYGIYVWRTGEKYEGEWKKGMRHGKGIFTFRYFDRDTTITGVWKEDKYVGEKDLQDYEILYRTGVGHISCMRVGDRPYVRYRFTRNGAESQNISGLLMQGSSGTEQMTGSFIGFEQVEFPFEGNLKFFAPNAFYSATITCEVRLVINKPGAWVVSISF